MLEKIKALMQMDESVGQIQAKLASHTQEIEAFKVSMDAANASTAAFRTNQQELLSSLQEHNAAVKEVHADLSKELFDFKLLKSQLQQSVLSKFQEELQKELKVSTESLKDGMQEYQKAKEQLANITAQLSALTGELAKFSEISRAIKKDDFEMVKTLQLVRQGDAEKLELMQKIDALERLVAKMRRRQ